MSLQFKRELRRPAFYISILLSLIVVVYVTTHIGIGSLIVGLLLLYGVVMLIGKIYGDIRGEREVKK